MKICLIVIEFSTAILGLLVALKEVVCKPCGASKEQKEKLETDEDSEHTDALDVRHSSEDYQSNDGQEKENLQEACLIQEKDISQEEQDHTSDDTTNPRDF